MSVQDRIASLSPAHKALLDKLLAERKAAAVARQAPSAIARVTGPDGAGDWPLSFDQERLWILALLDPEGTAYNLLTATRLLGALDVSALRTAVREIVRRQGALRTSFPAVDGTPVQRVAPSLAVALPVVDLTGLPLALREPATLGLVGEATRQPFSLERGPLVRATLLRLDAQEHVCIVAIHHIVSDQITFQLFWRELGLLYEAFSAGQPSPLPELPVQLADFVVWQRGWLQGEALESALGWWQERLQGFPQVLDLPADRPRPARESLRGRRQPVRFDAGLTRGLRELARREQSTRFMTVTALAASLFHRLSGQDRLILGTLNANRNRIELEPLFGFFLTQLPLAIDLTGDPPFRELLARVRGAALGAYGHQDLPFGKLVEVMQPERELGRMPLVQALIQLFEVPAAAPVDPRLRIEPIEVHDGNTRYDLMLAVTDDVDMLHGYLESNAEIFDATTTARMLELLLAQAAAVAADPALPLSELPAFPPAVRQQMLVEWNDTDGAEVPDLHATIVDLFLAQAARTPEALAWRGPGWSLTYARLEEESARLAHLLRRRGFGPESLIGLLVERTRELPIALFGILRSGAGYLPLDIAHPQERRAFVLEDAGADLVLTQEHLLPALPEGAPTLCLHRTDRTDGTDLTDYPTEPSEPSEPLPLIDPTSRAYVIYTSGSTGRPKGVEIEHRSLASYLRAMRRIFPVDGSFNIAALGTITFDISMTELYLPLLGGGSSTLLSRETAGDGALLAKALEDHGVTVLQATPALFNLLLETGWRGRPDMTLLCGAEAMSGDLADRLLPCGRALWNVYGPTETTVWCSAWRVERGAPISIGWPIDGYRIYLLDRQMAPVPLGAVGEIAVGGIGLGRDYLRRPELTADRFVPNPFADTPGARLYRTGDLGRLRRDGRLDHLGRADYQIKLRSFRIEPGEIEVALRSHPAVAEAVVLLREDQPGAPYLAAYLGVPAGPAPDAAELREHLRRTIPEYMIPSAFVTLPALPRNANSKVDRKVLPAPEGPAAGPAAEPVAPRDEIEAEVASLWQRLLGVERVGIFDNFFELGGHSLLANRVVAAVRQTFQVEIPLRALFLEPTVAGVAAAINQSGARPGGPEPEALPIERQRRTGEVQRFPVSFSQLREWILDRIEPGSPAYNIPTPIRVAGPVSIPVLLASLQEIVRRHESLRTTFESGPEEPFQVVAPHLELPVGMADLSGLPAAQREAELQRLLAEDLGLGFDLAHGPLLRARLVRLSPDDHAGLFTIHHIVSDGWSVGVFLRDLGALYEAFAQGRPSPLPPLPLQYPDFAVWQRGRLQGAVLDEQIGYWRQRLAGVPPALDLPADRPRPAVRSSLGEERPAGLPRPLVDAMRSLALRQGGSLFMALLAGWQALLARLTGEDDICVGTFSGNRPRVELEGLIGFFINTLALRTDLSGTPSFRDLLGRVSEVTLGAYAHQEIPFEKLLESLDVPRDPARTPLFQTMLVLQNFPRQGIELSEVTLAPLPFRSQRANFDVTLWLFEAPEGIAGHVDYSTDLFEGTTVERLLGHLRTLLEAAVADPDRDLRDLPLLTPAERAEIVERQTEPVPEGEPLLHRLVEQQAARTPQAVAIESIEDGRRLTYADLDEQAGQLARRLRQLGVGPETRVALTADRAPELLVGMLGILKAGGAYVPLDPGYPQERLAFMLEDSGAAVVLGKDLKDLKDLNDKAPSSSFESFTSFRSFPSFEDSPAYLIYTSGSTGRPKGVVVPHRSIAAYTRTAVASYEITPADRVLQFGSISFDTSAEEIWPALAAGATLVLRSAEMSLSIERFLEEVAHREITVLNLQTAFWHEVVAGLSAGLALPPTVRLVIIGGEAALPDRLAAWREQAGPGVRLVNTYGPTEATIVATRRDLTLSDDDPEVPIGRPIPGARVHLVDPRGEPVPPLVPGELLIGGAGVARGYLGRPDLTAERFVPDPWSPEPGARLYRSGDLACFRPGGELLFRGRADRQLKLRGFRIEPGEIEAALRLHPALHDAVADLRGTGDDKRLIAWVVPRPGETAPDGPALRVFLRERLPDALVPALFVPLAELPRTASGKLDRRALPEPAAVRPELPGYAEPSTPLERTIAGIFRDLLRVDRVGLHDNFFDLGGHSLLVVRAHQKLGEELGREIPVVDLFRFPTVALLARHLGGADEPTFERVQSLAEKQRAAQQRQRQALEKLRRPGGLPKR